MFTGEYPHALDAKGRLIIPAKLRERLGDHFVVTKGLDRCLYAYPDEEWNRIEALFREKSLASRDVRKFMRVFFGGAWECEADKQGRVQLPPNLREYAGLEKELISVGSFNHVEIWSREIYLDDISDTDMNQIGEHLSEMGVF